MFPVNFTLLKYVKSQRNGFLVTKELIFGFQNVDLKYHFSACLKQQPNFSGGLSRDQYSLNDRAL